MKLIKCYKCERPFGPLGIRCGFCVENEKQDLLKQIDSLKCCGNCKYYRIIINEGRCFVGLPQDEWRHSLKAKFASGDEKCDKWEQA
jgi:hypothetical protein